MVSIGRLINQKGESALRYIRPLFAALSRTAIPADPDEVALFRQKIDDLSQALSDRSEPQQILEQIAEVTQLVEEYNQGVTRSFQNYRGELRGMLSMMAETVAALSQSNQTGIQQLQTIETSLANAATLDDVKALRNKLAVCLTLVRNESARVRHESDKLVSSLKSAVVRASSHASPHLDRATTLPGPGKAAQIMGRLIEEGKPFHAIMFLLNNLVALNARFGREGGDEALLLAARHLENTFSDQSVLVRWNGPAFLLIAEDSQITLDAHERAVKEALRNRFEASIAINHQTVRVPLSFSWTSQRVTPSDSVDAVCRKLDALVAKHITPA